MRIGTYGRCGDGEGRLGGADQEAAEEVSIWIGVEGGWMQRRGWHQCMGQRSRRQ